MDSKLRQTSLLDGEHAQGRLVSAREKEPCAISVRELAGFVWRRGDLTCGGGLGPSAKMGRQGHQQLQRSREGEYLSEVSLSQTVITGGIELKVTGRADGVYLDCHPRVLEEIKTTTSSVVLLRGDNPVHRAQAWLYAAMYAESEDLDQLIVKLTYLDLTTHQVRSFEETASRASLAAFFFETVASYTDWLKRVFSWQKERTSSLSDLGFPFDRYRPGQRELAASVLRTGVAERRSLFAEAPTGSGKTMAVLFGAVKALSYGHISQVIYLTSKTVGRLAAESAIRRTQESGGGLKALSLASKRARCKSGESICRADRCPLAAGHFDRLRSAMEALFEQQTFFGEEIVSVSTAHRVCPYWLSREMVPWADVVVCDYNYLFDPRAALSSLTRNRGGPRLVLVDEAHNLVERAREMFSAEIDARTAARLEKEIPRRHRGMKKRLQEIRKQIGTARQMALPVSRQRPVLEAPPRALLNALTQFCELTELFFSEAGESSFGESLMSFYFEALVFLRTAAHRRGDDITCVSRDADDAAVKLLCLDPGPRIEEILESAALSRVFFSATLSPIDYFSRLLGGQDKDETMTLTSPFSSERLFAAVASDISTRFRDRRATAARVREMILTVARARKGNYLVFFPSFEYLDLIAEGLAAEASDVEILCQRPNQNEKEKRAFLHAFEIQRSSTLLGLAVLGGLFGEGIDLSGSCLIGAIVVSPGLPKLTLERELIREHFDKRDGAGFDFAYRFPGMNKVVQAAGRVIRAEADRGVNLFIGERFLEPAYRCLIAGQGMGLRGYRRVSDLASELDRFWRSSPRE